MCHKIPSKERYIGKPLDSKFPIIYLKLTKAISLKNLVLTWSALKRKQQSEAHNGEDMCLQSSNGEYLLSAICQNELHAPLKPRSWIAQNFHHGSIPAKKVLAEYTRPSESGFMNNSLVWQERVFPNKHLYEVYRSFHSHAICSFLHTDREKPISLTCG